MASYIERLRITPSIQIQGFLLACEASALGTPGGLIDRYEANARTLCEEMASNTTRKQARQVLCAALEQRELDMPAAQPSSPRPSTARRI